MSDWSLPGLLDHLHQRVEGELRAAREAIGHPTDKGDASETIWIEVLNRHLPGRYQARKAHVVDSHGTFSEQMDVVVHDRQYSPLVFDFKGTFVVPAESVYAAFEAKQELTGDQIAYAQKKIGSVRQLHRTSMPVPTVDGTKAPKAPGPILGGVLALSSAWSPPLGDTLVAHLTKDVGGGRLDLGCIADAGFFEIDEGHRTYAMHPSSKPATRFLFALMATLQQMGTVPMIDIDAYAKRIPE